MNKLNPDSSQHKFNGGYFDKTYMIDILHERFKQDQLILTNNKEEEITKEIELIQEIELTHEETKDSINMAGEFENIYPNNETFEVDKSQIQIIKVKNEDLPNISLKKKVDNIIKLKRW